MHQYCYNSGKATEIVATFFLFFLVLQDQQHWHCEASKNDVYVHSILCLLSLNARNADCLKINYFNSHGLPSST